MNLLAACFQINRVDMSDNKKINVVSNSQIDLFSACLEINPVDTSYSNFILSTLSCDINDVLSQGKTNSGTCSYSPPYKGYTLREKEMK